MNSGEREQKMQEHSAQGEQRRALGQRQAETASTRLTRAADEQEASMGAGSSSSSEEPSFVESGLAALYSALGYGINEAEAPSTQQPKRFPGKGDYTEYRNEAAERIKGKLEERGLPSHIAKGFTMNFADESGFDPIINEREPLVKGSRGGFGIYQLTGPRRVAYEKFVAERGINPNDLMAQEDAQLDWLMYELENTENSAWQKIKTAEDEGTAAALIVKHFLRPSKEHMVSRVAKYTGRKPEYITPPKRRPIVPRKGA